MKPTTIRWETEDLERIGAAARLLGISRSQLIREAALAATNQAPLVVARRLKETGAKLVEIQGETE